MRQTVQLRAQLILVEGLCHSKLGVILACFRLLAQTSLVGMHKQ